MDPLLVIMNADAGTAAEETLERGLEVLRERTSVEVAQTSNPGELDGVLHRAGSRRIVVAGGDGSLHAVVAALHRRHDLADAVIALLPMGTGNDFARAMEIPLEIEEAAQVVLEGEVRRVDLILDDTGQVVVNNVHVGAGAQASRRGARWKERLGSIGVGKVNLGRIGYPIGAVQAAFKPPAAPPARRGRRRGRQRPRPARAHGGDRQRHSVGGGAELTPEADAEDGRIDIMISRAIGPLAKLGYAVQVMRRTHLERDDVLQVRGTRVSVSGEEFYCAADGEITGPERQRAWRLEPAAYSMVLP